MIKRTILFLLICIVLAGCAQKKQLAGTHVPEALNGTWELDYISGPSIAFQGLYPERKPTLTFDTEAKTVAGNTSCNSLQGALNVSGKKIDFNRPFAMTKMFCPGEAEQVFVEALRKVDTYSITDGNTLNLIMGDIAIMRFRKK